MSVILQCNRLVYFYFKKKRSKKVQFHDLKSISVVIDPTNRCDVCLIRSDILNDTIDLISGS